MAGHQKKLLSFFTRSLSSCARVTKLFFATIILPENFAYNFISLSPLLLSAVYFNFKGPILPPHLILLKTTTDSFSLFCLLYLLRQRKESVKQCTFVVFSVVCMLTSWVVAVMTLDDMTITILSAEQTFNKILLFSE